MQKVQLDFTDFPVAQDMLVRLMEHTGQGLANTIESIITEENAFNSMSYCCSELADELWAAAQEAQGRKMETLDDPVVSIFLDGSQSYIVDSVCEFFGSTPTEAIGHIAIHAADKIGTPYLP